MISGDAERLRQARNDKDYDWGNLIDGAIISASVGMIGYGAFGEVSRLLGGFVSPAAAASPVSGAGLLIDGATGLPILPPLVEGGAPIVLSEGTLIDPISSLPILPPAVEGGAPVFPGTAGYPYVPGLTLRPAAPVVSPRTVAPVAPVAPAPGLLDTLKGATGLSSAGVAALLAGGSAAPALAQAPQVASAPVNWLGVALLGVAAIVGIKAVQS